MDSFRILLALHGPRVRADLATELRSRGWILTVSRNLADTWAAAQDPHLDAILLAPLSNRPEAPELASLVRCAAEPGGPALLVLTDEPARLETHAEHLDDFLSPADDADVISRRLRFSIARNRALARLQRDRESLRAETTTDYKTGLRNDRYFAERCRIDAARSARDGRCLGVLMIDLDNFKAVNEDFGHPFADAILAEVAEVLRRGLRPFDTAARIGGDEFAVLLPATNMRDAQRIGERLRSEIEALRVDDRDEACVTATVGAASWDPLRGETFEESLAGADRALREAKRTGRNRVESHDGPRGEEVGAARA